MNLSTVALILLAWQLLGKDNDSQPRAAPPQIGLTDILSDDVKNIIHNAQKLSDSSCTQQDRAGAIFEIMSNPAVMNLASNLFGKAAAPDGSANAPQSENAQTNDEGYKFETPSSASQEFFRPIDNIADAEVKHKLYWFYDNWYNKQ